MIDTFMYQPTKLEQSIIILFLRHSELQSSDVHSKLEQQGEQISLVTVKRLLSRMAQGGSLAVSGSGRSTGYLLTQTGRLFAAIDPHDYIAIEPDSRYGRSAYDFDLLPSLHSPLFTETECATLESATSYYHQQTRNLPDTIRRKELERLVIELSWKSSKIEGNTYTLLETEKLILENIEAPGRDSMETQMILNHKEAFTYIHGHASDFKEVTKQNLEEVHSLLVKNLGVTKGLRETLVGITGSIYRPLDNRFQIQEAVEALIRAISRLSSPYEKALLGILGISYIQPFEDGNKRTGRLMGNSLLLSHQLAPLSYRSVNENEYREAVLVFYELGSLEPFKKIFISQYDFAARNYAVTT
jgi:Fic family protein